MIAYYTVIILDIATPPDLEFFVEYYMDPIGKQGLIRGDNVPKVCAANIQQSARMLFAARLANMTESQIETVAEASQAELWATVLVRPRS